MIVLHAGVSDSRLLLWGEMPVESQALAHQRSSQKHSDLLLYDARAEGLAVALLTAGVGFTIDKRHTEAWIAWLPTVDDQPVASSPLIAEHPQSHAPSILTPWTVMVMPLSAAQTVEILCACIGKQTLASGVVVGNDLVFWA